jgi:hypothetical protein
VRILHPVYINFLFIYFSIFKEMFFSFQIKTGGGITADDCQQQRLTRDFSFLKHLAFHFTTFQLDLQNIEEEKKSEKFYWRS